MVMNSIHGRNFSNIQNYKRVIMPNDIRRKLWLTFVSPIGEKRVKSAAGGKDKKGAGAAAAGKPERGKVSHILTLFNQ